MSRLVVRNNTFIQPLLGQFWVPVTQRAFPFQSSLPRLVKPNVRSFMRGDVRLSDPKVVEQVKKRQQDFQSKDDPVHLKDSKIHFYATTAIGLAALIGTMHGLYNAVK